MTHACVVCWRTAHRCRCAAGMSPNVLELMVDVPLAHPRLAAAPGLRAYLPNVQPPQVGVGGKLVGLLVG